VQRVACAGRALALVLVLLAGVLAAPARAAAPAGFDDQLLTQVDAPTALAFVSPSHLLIASQPGQLWVYQNGALLPTPALDLTTGDRVCANSERGLLGVAVDPSFATNRFIYVFYTFKKHGVCPTGQPTNASNPVNRVSRFTLGDSNLASGETVLIDNVPSPNGNHNAGDLHFGADDYLYASFGDGGADYAGDSGSAGNNDAARDQFILLGKIVRITRSGGIPPGNPFVGANTGRCHQAGRTNPGNRCQETFAWGLRNPFRFAFRPGTSQFYINDVGQNAWEEIDAGQAGADYGWNCREGAHPNNTGGPCNPAPPNMVDPVHEYPHGQCGSITGGAFVPAGVWPAEYDNAYLFGDYNCGTIFRLKPRSGGGFDQLSFITAANGPTAMLFGPYDGTQAFYYLAYNTGQVRRVVYTGAGNRSPVAVVSASPRSGPAPLVVQFDGRGSGDADGDALSYDWDFGDGAAHASSPNPQHTYAAGTWYATLRVSDGKGGSGTATVRIDSGNSPPVATIAAPAQGSTFAVGQRITLIGTASDPEDGTVPAIRLHWRVWLHHNNHRHRFLDQFGNNLTFTAPGPEDLAATTTSYLEIELTATDSLGLQSATVTRQLQPRLVDVTLNTVPAGLALTVNGSTDAAPRTFTSWEGYTLSIVAPAQPQPAGEWLMLAGWSDGPTVGNRTIVTLAAPASYTATFEPAKVVFTPYARR
jgi:glucose/arabinose dehydrogenase